MQAATASLRMELKARATEELRRSAGALEQPLEKLRVGLRHQGEAMVKARSRVSSALDELAAAARRSFAAEAPGSHGGGGEPGLGEAALGELREVRSMGKVLITNLEAGGRALEDRMEQVFAALVGKDSGQQLRPGGAGAGAGGRAAAAAAAGAGEDQRAAGPEAKKKRNKKKGRAEPEQPAAAAGAGGGGAVGSKAEATAGRELATAAGDCGEQRPRAPPDEDSRLRAEFREAFGGDGGKSPAAVKGEAAGSRGGNVLTGPELLHELQSLRSDAEAIEARMAQRLRARAQPSPEEEEEDPSMEPAAAAKPKAQRRKKLYV